MEAIVPDWLVPLFLSLDWDRTSWCRCSSFVIQEEGSEEREGKEEMEERKRRVEEK